MTPASDTTSSERLLDRVSLRLIPFLLVLYVISYLDRINLSFAAHQMMLDLSLSDQAYGFGAGIFFFGYCVFGIPSNYVIQRLGPRKWISSIMIAWGLVTLCMCLIRDQSTFYALRLILGVAEAGFFPGMLLYLTYWFPPSHYGSAVARFMTALPVAGVLGSLMAAQAFALGGMAGLAGWKWLFILTGLPAVIFGALTYFLLADRPSQAKWLTKEEGELIEAMTAKPPAQADYAQDCAKEQISGEVGQTKNAAEDEGSFFAALKNFTVWRFAFLYFSMSVCMYGFQLWLPQIVQTFGRTSDTQTALLSAIPAIFQGLGMQMVAASSDGRGERKVHLAVSCAVTFVGLISACLFSDAWMKLAGISVAAFGIWGTLGPFWALTRNNLRPGSQPAGIAFVNSVGGLGGFVGPYIVSFAKQSTASIATAGGEFTGALIVLAATSILTAILALSSPKSRKH